MDSYVQWLARASAWLGVTAVALATFAAAAAASIWAFNRSRKVGVIVSALKLYYSLSRTERFELSRVGPEVDSLRQQLYEAKVEASRLNLQRLLCTCGAHGEQPAASQGGGGRV